MKEILQIIAVALVVGAKNHELQIYIVFSAMMSKMPPLPENASWWLIWLHDGIQLLAANPNKFSTQQPGAPK